MEIKNIKNALVIYHREDNDGVCSAAIVSQFLKCYCDQVPTVHFFGCNYAELSTVWKEHQDFVAKHDEQSTSEKVMAKDKFIKWMTHYDKVFMVDISFNEVDAMEELADTMPIEDFIWCDHHHPIIEFSLKNLNKYTFGEVPGVRRTDQSALLNTWQYMNEAFGLDIKPSDVLVSLSDYDSWTWTSKDRYAGNGKDKLFALNTGFTRRSNLKVKWFEDYILNILMQNTNGIKSIENDCLQYGMTILQYDRERNSRAIKSHGDTSWILGGEKACAIFTTDRFNSQSFTATFAGTDIEHGIVFKREPDGRWVMGAYNVSEDTVFDCGDYLKRMYGGGGHKGAAGCTLSEEQFIEMLRTHKV